MWLIGLAIIGIVAWGFLMGFIFGTIERIRIERRREREEEQKVHMSEDRYRHSREINELADKIVKGSIRIKL